MTPIRARWAPTRREGAAIPVVLPLAEVSRNATGCFSVTVDRAPYPGMQRVSRAEIPRVLSEIAKTLNSPIRVEIHETDVSVYTDILTPPLVSATPESENVDRPGAALTSAGIFGSGFQPGEDVTVAIIISHSVADSEGRTLLRLPAALTDEAKVLLAGATSGVFMTSSAGS